MASCDRILCEYRYFGVLLVFCFFVVFLQTAKPVPRLEKPATIAHFFIQIVIAKGPALKRVLALVVLPTETSFM
jgi:hypothetical protein